MRREAEFTKAVLLGLTRETFKDPELLVLMAAGLGLGSRSRLLKGLGIGMAGWYITRKTDSYVMALDSKMSLLAGVIGASNTKEADGH